jgi:transcriptional regulator with XRE-family HTH domain
MTKVTEVEMAESVGSAIREARRQALLTQRELASRAGIGLTTLNRIENGWVEPQFRTIRKIAAALGIEAHELVKGGDDA